MALIINEEQAMLKNSAKEFFTKKGTIGMLRELRDSRDNTGYCKKLWTNIVELGATALVIPEAYMGLGFGYVGLGQILEQSGRCLTPSPLLSTCVLSTAAINLAGNTSQKEKFLTAIAEGTMTFAFAHEEGQRHDPSKIETNISKSQGAFLLNGSKTMVLDGHVADVLIVVAKTVTGLLKFAVLNCDEAGVSIERTIMMDSRNVAKIKFEDVVLSSKDLLDSAENMETAYHKVLDIGRIGLAAEMLGSIQEAFKRTVEYLKTREQFGIKIGTFQALQHRAAKLFCEIELSKSIVLKALQAIDEDAENLSLLASTAKAKVGQTYKLMSNEGIQMFGGIGMTDDAEIGFFLKRARVAQQTLGDVNFHLDRYARLKGY